METKLRRFLPAFFITSLILGSFACVSKNQDKADSVVLNPAAPDITGGFQSIPPESQSAQRAFLFLKSALAEKYPDLKLGPIIKAASQVVAGMNIKIICEYTAKNGQKKRKYLTAVVYRDLGDQETLKELNLDTLIQIK